MKTAVIIRLIVSLKRGSLDVVVSNFLLIVSTLAPLKLYTYFIRMYIYVTHTYMGDDFLMRKLGPGGVTV